MKLIVGVAVAFMAFGCKDKAKQEPAKQEPAKQEPAAAPAPQAAAKSCADQTAELKTWLQGVADGKPVAAPWPTGDSALDTELTAWRGRVRELEKPANPAEERKPLTPSSNEPWMLETAVAGCDPAKAVIAKFKDAKPSEQAQTLVGLADAIASCDCKVDMARVKPPLYIMFRGAD